MTSMPIDLAEFDTDLEKTSAESESSDESLLRQFSVHGDAQAFEQLVVRHGPMVLGVCRRMLRDSHAADDAFQATFLVLVRRATSLRQPELLGNWLYGVAYRIAARARLQSVRRADHELRFPTMPETNQTQEVERRELQEVLDEELNQLPREYRDPLVLCYLQGKTNAEAAQLLGCPVGSISGKLSAAREKLRSRLKRRGLVASAGLFGASLLTSTARSEVPLPLLRATVDAADVGGGGSARCRHGLHSCYRTRSICARRHADSRHRCPARHAAGHGGSHQPDHSLGMECGGRDPSTAVYDSPFDGVGIT